MATSGNDSAELLRQLAQRAAKQPAGPDRMRFAYIRTKGRYRGTKHLLEEDGTLTLLDSRVDETEREFWIAADGSGRIEETRSGRRTDTSRTYGPGELYYPGMLPTESDELEHVMAQAHHGWGTFEWFNAVREVWATQVVSPQCQSALLRVLSSKPDMVSRGIATDAVGRAGIAISTDTDHWGRPQRYLLLFHPETGMLNAVETAELPADNRPDPDAADSGYTAWLQSAYVGSTDVRP